MKSKFNNVQEILKILSEAGYEVSEYGGSEYEPSVHIKAGTDIWPRATIYACSASGRLEAFEWENDGTVSAGWPEADKLFLD